MGTQPFGIAHDAARQTAEKIFSLQKTGIEIGVVIGGGNIFRGIQQGAHSGLSRVSADQVGMLATLMNGIALKEALAACGCKARVLSAIECPLLVENYQWERAMDYLQQGDVVIFVGGTGHPYFTTDTTAALRACEIQAPLLLKATMRVDGVYDKDPRLHTNAQKFDSISYKSILERGLGILDLSAITLCMGAKIDIRVFNFHSGSLVEAVQEKCTFGTIIKE